LVCNHACERHFHKSTVQKNESILLIIMMDFEIKLDSTYMGCFDLKDSCGVSNLDETFSSFEGVMSVEFVLTYAKCQTPNIIYSSLL
jgi:hypothetical protein